MVLDCEQQVAYRLARELVRGRTDALSWWLNEPVTLLRVTSPLRAGRNLRPTVEYVLNGEHYHGPAYDVTL